MAMTHDQDADPEAADVADRWAAQRRDRPPPRTEDARKARSGHQRDPVWRAPVTRSVRTWSFLAAAVVVLFFLGDTFGWFGSGDDRARATPVPYVVEALDGLLEVQRHGSSQRVERLDVETGDRLICDADTRAVLHVTGAGMLRMEQGTELRVENRPAMGWRFYLERGQVTASIIAAPRLFQVGTPAGLVVDLGCVFTATVGDDGKTILLVRGGQVSFEEGRRKVFVPSGARVVAWPGRGPGTPVWGDASGPLRKAVARLDELVQSPALDLDVSGDRSALDELARISEPRHSLSLWYLLDHPHPQVARAAFEQLDALVPPPPEVDRDDIRAGHPAALALWRTELQAGW